MKMPIALSIAGVDPSGGAGIFADIKTFSAFRVYGMGVVTALTSQNTYEVNGIKTAGRKFFQKQINTVLKDIKPDSVKTGMIPDIVTADVIYESLMEHKLNNLVIDPVMISKQGAFLSSRSTIRFIIKKLFPLSLIITPNIPEASYISGIKIKNVEDMISACKKISRLGPKNVLLKGGHMEGDVCVDVLFDGKKIFYFKNKRIKTKNTHGTGCTLSAAICANLSKGKKLLDSVEIAINYVNKAIRKSLDIGKGNGPLNHMP
ncbi:MAG: bifunctional hydroxymethylpyrimidine kinase/phosphomethylpyrimidine kinase [Elusimicrobiales bacterium]|jgi:hydroxymethylpyrimidine/phosphomethylpyrimidine kinase|nr:bifunctional hydroxymethylpyrimidine kinase/phosphomethylpyrimidine kinase [Elusimicrobiales bacterium]HOL62380.1 bifunctional hydroxymethylpyrimidine kinase/phosphomethylpyrimidine kinase [Elusimicrobiales bacterium]HPO96112.1 bifunctional hydroxymethylpyrimidine kinase/phosphomethylpyrimidine kinase [Elusimicrobiales bacterium]